MRVDVMNNCRPECDAHNACHECDAHLEVKTLCKCDNWPSENPGLFKVPVVVAEFVVQICVEGDIHLPRPALEIKRIQKSVCLTECRLVSGTCKLFLKGFIRKNIEFTAINGDNDNRGGCICGDIMDTTCFVPFHCCTEVPFIDPEHRGPFFKKNRPPKEVTFVNKSGMCQDLCEKDFIDVEHFNEKVKCELEDAIFHEAEIEHHKCRDFEHNHEQGFQDFTEKLVLHLKLKLLQKQQIHMPSSWSPSCKADCDDWRSGTPRSMQMQDIDDDDCDPLENDTDFR